MPSKRTLGLAAAAIGTVAAVAVAGALLLRDDAAADHSAIREAARRAAVERWSWASVADRLLALGR